MEVSYSEPQRFLLAMQEVNRHVDPDDRPIQVGDKVTLVVHCDVTGQAGNGTLGLMPTRFESMLREG